MGPCVVIRAGMVVDGLVESARDSVVLEGVLAKRLCRIAPAAATGCRAFFFALAEYQNAARSYPLKRGWATCLPAPPGRASPKRSQTFAKTNPTDPDPSLRRRQGGRRPGAERA